MSDGIKTIEAEAFAYSGLKSFDSGNGVVTIGDNALKGCTSLETIKLGTGVKLVEVPIGSSGAPMGGIFVETTAVKSVTVAADNPYIKSDGNCILTKNGATVIAGFACSVIPEGVTRIGRAAFAYQGLTTVTIPASVKQVGDMAFAMNAITEIVVESTQITTIESSAFIDYYNTSPAVYFKGDSAQWNAFYSAANKAQYMGGQMIQNANYAGKVYLYSETTPPADGNKYWHYGTDGKPEIYTTDAAAA